MRYVQNEVSQWGYNRSNNLCLSLTYAYFVQSVTMQGRKWQKRRQSGRKRWNTQRRGICLTCNITRYKRWVLHSDVDLWFVALQDIRSKYHQCCEYSLSVSIIVKLQEHVNFLEEEVGGNGTIRRDSWITQNMSFYYNYCSPPWLTLI